MQESMSSSRITAFYGNNYDDYCNYQYHHHQQPPPVPAPPAAVTATASDDFEDADSGWTTYFLQLASDEEDDASAAASNREKQQLRDVGAVVPCGSRSGRGSASTVSKPNKDKDNNKQAVKKKKALTMKGMKKSRIVEEEEEEDSLQDTASSPLLLQVININGHLPADDDGEHAYVHAGSLEHYCRHDEHHNSQVTSSSRDRPPVQRRSGGDINVNGRIERPSI